MQFQVNLENICLLYLFYMIYVVWFTLYECMYDKTKIDERKD